MNMSRIFKFPSSNFRRLLATTYVCGIVLLIVIATLITSNLSSKSVRDSLQKTGTQLVESFADKARLALIYQSEDEAKLVIDAILEFPDVLQAGIYNEKEQSIYISNDDLKSLNLPILPAAHNTPFTYDNDNEWIYSSAIYSTPNNEATPYFEDAFEPQLLGYVQLKIGKGTLTQLRNDFYKYNLLVIGVLAIILLWALLTVTNRVTKPIHHLAENMQNAAKGGKRIRAEIGGTQDIIRMEEAFNNLMDILEKRQSELLSTRDLALEAAKVKGEFAANVSHELRTPLNGISGMLELLSEMSLTVQQKEYLRVASSSADSLLELIDDVLDFSIYDQKDITFNNSSFNVRKSLEEFIILLSPQAHRKNISLAYFIDADVPKNIISDSARLQQILHNLLGNALKFTHAGSVSLSVSNHRHDSTGISLLFEVTDTGIGIPMDAQEKVFEAFSQADSSTTREYGGTGLGLAICKQLVNLFGGEIGVNSTVENGSTFWFTIMVEPDDEANASYAVLQSLEPSNSRVLYVGDDHICKKFMEQQLEVLSYSAEFVDSGSTALQKLRNAAATQNAYDTVIIDELRNGMSQTALVNFIIDDDALKTANIILTVNHLVTELDDSSSFKSLTKPVRETDLLNALGFNQNLSTESSTDNIRTEHVDKDQLEYKHAHILVVEDNRANQHVAKAMLERFKCAVTIASNGHEAIEIASRDTFDLIFMDCQMPEMDGYEATYQLRKLEGNHRHTTIVAMTANKQPGDREKCLAVGMDDFLSKPLKLDKLSAVLHHWLGSDECNITIVSEEESLFAGSSVIDEKTYAYLEENLGKDIQTVLQLFLDDTPEYLNELDVGIKSNNLSMLSAGAHTIKSSAASFGALRLSKACESMEKACADSDIDSLLLHHKRILFEAEQVFNAVDFKLHPNTSRKRDSDRNSAAMHPDQNRVLIIDDDRTSRFTLKKALEKEGYLVDEVINGEQGLQYCERIKPDLIIIDAVMPGIDGFQTCEKVTHRFGGNVIPIIMVTSLDNEASINKAFAAGASDYISKPINFSLFNHRVHRLLSVKHVEKQISDLAHKDPLTGLINRNLFTKKVAETLTIHQRKKKIVALIFLDLNRFKLVNDSYGHEAGDLLLKVVAERLTRSVRKNDIVSRFGGDEFVIALTDIKSINIIEKLAEKIQTNLSRPFVFMGKEMHIGASIGISVSSTTIDTNISTLIKNADIAMYQSKELKEPHIFYDQSMEDSINHRLSIENDLRGAIDRDELKVHYQPQFNISTGELIGMEALVRWLHPDKGLIPPDKFIGLSEETGQIHMIGEWVLESACSCLKNWLDRGIEPITVSVNLSAHQLADNTIINKISTILDNTQLPNKLLELEITESSVMHNEDQAIEKLESLKRMGVKLAIDDFGTGYSSLSYLKRFPINLLKIDRSFVMNSLTDKVDADIIRTIVILAHSMGVEVIAEGVETEEQKALLAKLNCDYMQGYLLGKPISADEFEKTFFPTLQNNIKQTI